VRHSLTVLLTALLVAGAIAPAQPRGFQLLVLVALLAALGSAGRRTARWLLPEEGPLSRAVAAFSIATAAGTVPATWLGHCGLLRPSWFLLAVAGVLLLSRLVPAVAPSGSPADGEPAAPPVASPWPARLARAERALLLAAASAFAIAALTTLREIRYEAPGYFGGDDISYHLSAVATWIRHGDLRMIKFSYGDTSTAFYPILGELCSWILIAPLRDSDFFARWTQLPFALFTGAAIAALARRLGLSWRSTLLAVLLYATIRNVFPVLSLSAGNDHSTAFFTLAALDGTLALARRPRPGTAAVAGLGFGLLLATKYIAVLFAPTVVAVGLAVALARPENRAALRSARWRALAGLAGLLAGAAALAGGYTYLRNAWTTGNPIFPAPVRVLGIEIPGWKEVTLSTRRHSPEFAIDLPGFFFRRDLFGPLFAYTMLPAALLAPLVAIIAIVYRRQRRPRQPLERRLEDALVLALPAVFFLQFLYLMHDHRDMRYFLPGVALAALAFAWLTEQVPAGVAFPLRAIPALMMIHGMAHRLDLRTGGELAFAAVLVAGAALVLWLRGRAAGPRLESFASPAARRDWAAAAAISLALAALGSGKTVERYQARKLRHFHAALALEEAAGPGGATVAYAGYNQPYPFFGSRLQNDVEIVPTSWALDSQYYRWNGDIEFPFHGGTFRRWWRILGAYGVDFVVIHRSPGENPERQWVVRRPDLFQPVYQNGPMEVWRVLRAAPPRRGRR
jgi:hypothetical protein